MKDATDTNVKSTVHSPMPQPAQRTEETNKTRSPRKQP